MAIDGKTRKVKLTPHEAAKAKCCDCLGLDQFNRNEIQNCKGDTVHLGPCPLFPYRLGKRPPVRVFRTFCLQCMCNQAEFVRECETVTCPVHPYRRGRNPARAGMGDIKNMVKTRAEWAVDGPESTIRAEREEMVTRRGIDFRGACI